MTYKTRGWPLEVNNYEAWEEFKLAGEYEPANDYEVDYDMV